MNSKIVKRIVSSLIAVSTLFSCATLSGIQGDISAAFAAKTVDGIAPTVSTLYSGVTYSHYDLPSSSVYGKKDFSVVEFDLAQRDLYFDVVFAGEYSNQKSKTTSIVDSFNATNTEGKTAIAATNADLWMVGYAHARQEKITYNGVEYPANMKKTVTLPRGFNVSDGEIISSSHIKEEIPYEGDFQTFGVTSDYIPFLANPGTSVSISNITRGATSFTTEAINRLPVENATIVYTDKGCLNNYALDDAYEVVIDFDFDYKIQHGTDITGKVTAVYGPNNSENPTMQENRIILTARGSAETMRLKRFRVGDEINIKVETYDRWGKYDEYVQDMQEGTGGHIPLVVDGDYYHDTNASLTNRYATSIVGYTAEGTIMMIALDSISDTSSSRYFRISEMSYLAKELGLVNAFLLDGGGSTTLVTLDGNDYKIQGTPSDGSERSVINAIVLSYGPKRTEQGEFTPAQPVEFTEDLTNMRFDSDNLLKYFKDPNNASAKYNSAENSLELTMNSIDPYYHIRYSKSEKKLSADTYKYIVMTYKNPTSNSSAAKTAGMFFCAGSVTAVDGNLYKAIPLSRENSYVGAIVDMSDASYWTGNINTIRLDFFENASSGNSLFVHSIVLCRTELEAERVMKREVEEANTHVHSYSDAWLYNESEHYRECECGEIADKAAHIFGDWEIVTEATANTEGKRKRSCLCGYTETEIIPCTHIPGDINNDGEINTKDLTRLMKYIAGDAVDVYGPDVNGDDGVTTKDLTRLMKFLAGDKVELH